MKSRLPGFVSGLMAAGKPMAGPREKRKKLLRQIARYSTIGLEMGFSVAIGGVLGYFLDRWLGTGPWLTLVFLILGSVAAFRSLFSLVKAMEKNNREEDPS